MGRSPNEHGSYLVTDVTGSFLPELAFSVEPQAGKLTDEFGRAELDKGKAHRHRPAEHPACVAKDGRRSHPYALGAARIEAEVAARLGNSLNNA